MLPPPSCVCIVFQRGKFYPQLTNLVRINTPRAVQTESKKAFKKLPNLDAAVATLTKLKGVGTTLASGVPEKNARLAYFAFRNPLPPPFLPVLKKSFCFVFSIPLFSCC